MTNRIIVVGLITNRSEIYGVRIYDHFSFGYLIKLVYCLFSYSVAFTYFINLSCV